MSRDGLFLRVCIADAAPDVQMAQRISVKLRITVVAVGLSDTNVSRETVKKFRRTKREGKGPILLDKRQTTPFI
jgi:hypothetical protein